MNKIIFNILNPFFLFNTIWIILIVGHKFSFTLWSANGVSYVWIIVSLLSFSFGSLATIFAFFNKKTKKTIEYLSSKEKLYNALKVVFKIFLLEEIILYFKLGLPPLLNPSVSRSNYYLSIIGSFYLFYVTIIYLATVLKYSNYKKIEMNIILMLTMSFLILKGNKFAIIEAILIYIFTRLITLKKQISIRKVVFIVILILLIVILLNKYFYLKYYNLDLEKIMSINGYKGDKKYSIFILPYLYIFSNVENILNYINSSSIYTYGSNITYGFLKLFFIDKFFPNIFINDFGITLKYSWLNTGTYLLPIFSDFKYIGLLIYPYLMGVISQYFYLKCYLKRASLLDNFLCIAFLITIFFSFFTNYLSSISFAINLIVIIFIKRKSGIKNENFSSYGNL